MTADAADAADRYRAEVHEHRMSGLKAMQEQANDLLDRSRERASWPPREVVTAVTATWAERVPRRVAARAPVAASQLRLVAGGGGWMGTFTVTARFLLADVLADGEPITARLVLDDGGPADDVLVMWGRVAAYSGNLITFADGATVTDETLVSVTV